MESQKTNLSSRGDVFASPKSIIPMLEVVCDLWDPEKNPGGYVSLGVAENTLMHDEVIEFMTNNLSIDSHSLTYGDGFSGSHRLRGTIARFVNRHFNPFKPVTKDQLLVTSGVGQAVEISGFTLLDKGDGVLLACPHYGQFPNDLGYRVGAQVIGVSFVKEDPFSLQTVDSYEKALADAQNRGIRMRAMLLCNPHNPLGRCYTREVLEAYMRFCQKHNLHLITDEIYALSTWKNPDAPDAPGFTSVLSINTDGLIDPSLVHVLWGMSKDFGSNGIRLGCLISQSNVPLLRAAQANSYFSCPSSLSDLVSSRILADDHFVESFIQTNRLRLAENYSLTARFLEAYNIPFKRGSNAGFFIWGELFDLIRTEVDNSIRKQVDAGIPTVKAARALETRLQTTLLNHRVFLAMGSDFGGDVPGWYRIVFAHKQDYLKLGLDRMIEAIGAFRTELENE